MQEKFPVKRGWDGLEDTRGLFQLEKFCEVVRSARVREIKRTLSNSEVLLRETEYAAEIATIVADESAGRVS